MARLSRAEAALAFDAKAGAAMVLNTNADAVAVAEDVLAAKPPPNPPVAELAPRPGDEDAPGDEAAAP